MTGSADRGAMRGARALAAVMLVVGTTSACAGPDCDATVSVPHVDTTPDACVPLEPIDAGTLCGHAGTVYVAAADPTTDTLVMAMTSTANFHYVLAASGGAACSCAEYGPAPAAVPGVALQLLARVPNDGGARAALVQVDEPDASVAVTLCRYTPP